MTQAFVVLTLLVMYLVVHAVIDEPGLSRFCRQLSLDMPGGLTAEQRVEENNICKQVFPYAMKGRKASELCRYFAPFPIANITEADDSVTCRWKSLTTCKNPKSILIKGKCLYLGKPGNYSGTENTCPKGGKIHRVTDDQDARWITILLPNTRPVWVANRKNDTSREMMVNDLIWDGDDFRKDDSDVNSLALLMRKNDLHEMDAGKIIKIDKKVKTEELKVVCSEYAVTYAGADGGESIWNALPEGIATSANKRVIVTSSVHQPTATSNKNINTKHFHDICKKICRKCFVALSGMPELTAADEISYIPARLQTDEVKENDKCVKHKFSDVLRKWFHQQLKNGNKGTLDTSSWESSYPDNMCADTLRTAVVSQKNGKIRDSPAITRHYLTCVMGDEPGVEPFSLCRAYSEPDGNGGCKCLPDFVDVTETTLEEANWFAKGQLCVTDKICGQITQRVGQPLEVFVLIHNCGSRSDIWWTDTPLFLKNMFRHFPSQTMVTIGDGGYHGVRKQRFTLDGFLNYSFGSYDAYCYDRFLSELEEADRELKIRTDAMKIVLILYHELDSPSDQYQTTKLARKMMDDGVRLIAIPIRDSSSYFVNTLIPSPNDRFSHNIVYGTDINEDLFNKTLNAVCKHSAYDEFVRARKIMRETYGET